MSSRRSYLCRPAALKRVSLCLWAAPPSPPPSRRAEGLLTPAAECLIAGSGEKQRSASRLEMVTPSPSRCRRSRLRNKLHSHLPLRYPPHQTCTTPSDPPAPADCSSHMHTHSTSADPSHPNPRLQD